MEKVPSNYKNAGMCVCIYIHSMHTHIAPGTLFENVLKFYMIKGQAKKQDEPVQRYGVEKYFPD